MANGHGGIRPNSGRKKGTKNKDTAFRAAIKEGIPIEIVLADIALIEEPKDRVNAYVKLYEFAHPKMKSIEHSGSIFMGKAVLGQAPENE